jgi:SNF2 family DNA or RNA helicase
VDGKKEIGGARNLDTLRSRLEECLVRRLRKDVLGQLPPRTDTRVPVEMTPEQQGEHDELVPPIVRLVAISKTRPLTQAEFLRLMMLLTTQRIISNGLAQLRFQEVWPSVSKIEKPTDEALKGLSSPKLAELRELVGRLVVDQGRKVVVFSQWRRMLKLAHWAIRDLLEGEGLRAAFFTGHEGQKKRTQNIVDFHDDPQVAMLFASDAGGVGLNLQRAANAVINLELPWNPAVLEQRIGRIYRLGQKSPIDVYNLACEYGIESRILDLVGSKKAFFTGLFDGTSDEVRFERSGSFLSRIEKLVGPVQVPELPKVAETAEEDPAAERELERLTADTDGAEPEERPAAAAALPRPEEVQKLFSRLSIRKDEKGGVIIEAPEETAGTLAALFQGMAEMLRGGKR